MKGPEGGAPGQGRRLLDEAQDERDRAEDRLARRIAAFRTGPVPRKPGLTEVQKSLPARSALVAFARYDRRTLPSGTQAVAPGGNAHEQQVCSAENEIIQSYLAVVLNDF